MIIKYFSSQSDWSWKLILIGTLILPLFPTFGIISYALALINICKEDYQTFLRHPLTWSWGVFGLWLIITSCFAYKPVEAFLGLGNLLPFIGMFITFRWVITKSKQLFLLAWLINFSSIPIVIMGLGQLFWGWVSPQFLPPLVGWTLRLNGVPEGRMSSVFIYANILALYLLTSLILSTGLWINTYRYSGKIAKKKPNYALFS